MNRLTTFRHVDSHSLPFLKDAIEEWLNVVEKLANIWSWKDVPWGYTERALLSTLAAAVWKSGGVAFEEYSTEKRPAGRRITKKKKTYTGRCDLYIKIGKREFITEAKHVWSAAGKKARNPIPKIQESLNEAVSAIKRTKSYGEERLAMVFVAPYIPTSQKTKIDEQVKNWISKIREMKYSIKYLSIALFFPINGRTPMRWGKWFFPGVALLIKKI